MSKNTSFIRFCFSSFFSVRGYSWLAGENVGWGPYGLIRMSRFFNTSPGIAKGQGKFYGNYRYNYTNVMDWESQP
jgi:hypothetical protein